MASFSPRLHMGVLLAPHRVQTVLLWSQARFVFLELLVLLEIPSMLLPPPPPLPPPLIEVVGELEDDEAVLDERDLSPAETVLGDMAALPLSAIG